MEESIDRCWKLKMELAAHQLVGRYSHLQIWRWKWRMVGVDILGANLNIWRWS